MGIQLKTVMKIYPFSQARLVAGKDGIERYVESANIQEVPDVERWLKGNEILFSSGYAFQNAENGCDLIRKLNYIGTTALAIKPGQYFERIPEEMIECADEIGFPLFEIPEELPYMDCIIPIFERITSEQLYITKRLTQMHENLMRTMLENRGLNGICSVLQSLTRNMVYILSLQGLILASSEEVDDSSMDIINDFAERYCSNVGRFKLQKNKSNQILIKENHWLVCVPIYIHKEYLAYLLLDMDQVKMEETDMMVFEQAGSMIAIELLKERDLLRREQTMKEQLLEDILLERYSDEEMIVRRENYLGYNISRRYCIFVVDTNSFGHYISRNLRNPPEDKIQKMKQDIQEIIRNGIESEFSQVLFCSHGTEMTGMLKIKDLKEIRRCQEVLKEIIQKLEKKYSPLTFSAGIGTIKKKISQAKEGMEEAKIALKTIKGLRNEFSENRACFYEDLGCLRFLSELAQSDSMKSFYEGYMEPLRAYDLANDAELVKTLECYFECNSNYRRTADRMFVHKNTVIYRIKQIENILNVSLEDWKVTFDLQLCLQLRYIL